MSLTGWIPKTVDSPRGAWAALKNRRVGNPSRGSAMQNMRVRFGTVRTRAGTSAVFTSDGKITGMANWIEPDDTNLVLYQDATKIKSYKQSDSSFQNLLTSMGATRAPVFCPVDVWNYFCGFDTQSNGTFQVRIFDGTNVDKAFRGPPTITAWTAVDGGAGQCTEGQHFIGFVYQNRTGYSGRPVTSITYAITATASVSFAVTATSNGSPDVLTVPGHTFSNGDQVTGDGATGDTAINGVFLIANRVAGVSVELTDLNGVPINGNGAYTGGGTLTAPDLVTAPGNNLQVGQTVTIDGSTGDTAINGKRIVRSTPTPGSTFTLTDTDGNLINSNGAYAGGGTVENSIQVTLDAGLRQINISVTLPAQADGGTDANGGVEATLYLIATRADNPNIYYFMPTDAQTGQVGEQPVPLNTLVTLNFVMSLSDEDIASQLAGDTAEANFQFLSQDAAGDGPFSPSFVAAYGTRMCYGAGTTLYVSDPNAPQQIAADTNSVRMQNQRKIGFAFQLPGNTTLFLTGDRWTGYVVDNNDSPSTWAQPVGVSDALGAQFPNLVCAATGGPFAWVVTEGGPYLFDGAYSVMPLTYLVSGVDEENAPVGWARVNWAAAYAIQIRDDVQNLKLYVAVPLDGATEPNYMFCIDYRMGRSFDTVDISLDVFNPQTFGSIAVIKEYASGESNLWIGPGAAGSVARLDPTVLSDLGAAIDNYWESGLVRGNGEIQSSLIRVKALDIWARGVAPLDSDGNPTYEIKLFTPDGEEVVDVDLWTTMGVNASLVPKPGLTYMSRFYVSQIENFYVRFRTNAVGSWQELSMFKAWMQPDQTNR